MSTLSQWLSPDLLRPLGLALLHFLWQGVAAAALAGVALAMSRRPTVRYAIALTGLAVMVAAPVVTFVALRGSSSSSAPMMVWPNPAGPVDLHTVGSEGRAKAPGGGENGGASAASLAWLVQAWFAGVLLFSARTAGGLLVIARMRRREATGVPEKLMSLCLQVQERLGLRRAIRYCGSVQLDAPAVAGWLRPVVFLPVTALTGLSEAQLETVIAHELAHVRRLDGLVNLLQIAAETLLFYHPGVWWISRRIREEREHCCDDAAIELCGNAMEYARALTLMEEWRSAPAMAMAANGNPLAARIARLLGIAKSESGIRNAGLAAGVLCLTAALLAGNALLGGARGASPGWHGAQEARAEQDARPAERDATFVITAPRPKEQEKTKAKPAPAPAPAPAGAPQVNPAPAPSGSYIDQMKAAGLETLSADELVGLKVQGITPDYVRAMKELSIPAKADDLIGMKVQGITPEYVREMRGVTGQQLGGDQLIGLKVQGVTAEYVKQLKELGLKTDADDVIGMKVQGVTPAYVRELRGMGLKADSDEIIGMKVQGITPEYVKSMQELGLKPSADELVGMKVQGINAAYLKEMQAAGFKLDIDDAIGAKVQGVTPAFIAKAKSYGFKDLTLEQIIRLKQSGVLDKQGEK
jgi:beta-lactamase regulating signal transducer with metallopeptidase domain